MKNACFFPATSRIEGSSDDAKNSASSSCFTSSDACVILNVPRGWAVSSIHQQSQQDRRFARRSNAALDVYLSGEAKSGRGITRNISRRGVFVQTNWRGFLLGARVDLTFVLKEPRVIKLRRFRAIVTRRSAGGLGLKFCAAPRLQRLEDHFSAG